MALAGQFDAILTEDLDRLSRNLADIARLYETTQFAGVKLMTVADGEISEMHIGLKGTMSALFLKGLAQKVRRGLAGVVRDGRSAGGRAYGYSPVPGRPGELAIVEAEATIIRRIFAEYLAGESPRAIAGRLNQEGVPPPRGRFWAAVTINGNRQRGHGLLLNPLYAGKRVWNRVRMVKDPATGKRISRVNGEGDWQEQDAPELAIVDRATYDAVQARRGERQERSPRERAAPRHLLSGLLRCGSCGAGISVKDRRKDRTRIRCTQASEARTCPDGRAYYLEDIEAAVVGGLRERLGEREAIALYVKTYNDERLRLAADVVNQRAQAEKRLGAAERSYDRAYRGYIDGIIDEEESARELPRLRAEKKRLQDELAALDEPPKLVTLHPAAVNHYLAAIETLAQTVRAGDAFGAESKTALRDLIATVTVHAAPAGENPEISVEGRLTKLIGGDHFPTQKPWGGKVVAGEGLATPSATKRPELLLF